jgi:hypothetical protein
VPKGQSLRARILVLEVSKGTVNWEIVTECQEYAAYGAFARTLSGYVRWLAAHYEHMQARLQLDVKTLRDRARSMNSHKRTPDIVANLGAAWRYFLDFAVDAGALSEEDSNEQWKRAWDALGLAAEAQQQHQVTSDPAIRFLQLVASAIASGNAHVADLDGSEPIQPESWGWRSYTVGTGDNMREEMRPQGARIGWVDKKDNLYLEPDAAYKAAQLAGKELGDGLAITSQTLKKRLYDHKLLASTDSARGTLTIRKAVEGMQEGQSRRMAVLHLGADTLWCPGEKS